MRRRWIGTVVALATGTLVVLAAACLASGLSDFVLTAAAQLGGSSGNARVASEAAAETDESAAELEACFAAQLKTAGWQRQAGAVDGALAWSSWKLPRDGDWQGLLFVIRGPGAGTVR